MSQQPTLAAAVIALDEEANLAALLPRLAWVDELMVVDGGSNDATVQVARRHGAMVLVRPFDNFAAQRNHAQQSVRSPWVLSIDADERPSGGLSREVRRVIDCPRYNAYRVPIRSTIFGRRLRFCGTQDDRPVRLFRAATSRWQGHVHERLIHSGRAGQLRCGLDHHTIPDAAAFLAKMNRYCALEVERRLDADTPPRRFDRWTQPAREVFRRLLWKLGVLDGPKGWAFCALGGLSEFVLAERHLKHWGERPGARSPSRDEFAFCPRVLVSEATP